MGKGRIIVLYNIDKIKNSIIKGDALTVLKNFPSDSIDCIFTSPPYYGLRKYDTPPVIFGGDKNCNHRWEEFIHKGISGGTKSKKVQIKEKNNFQIVPNSNQLSCILCGAWIGELGQEPTHIMFIDHLVEIFMECARILKPDGTMWINISDSYSGSNQGNGALPSGKNTTNRGTSKMQLEGHKSILSKSDISAKSLMCIPDRLKVALVDNGLICRNEIIWHKPNQMPSSAKDRFTNDYEKVYFFTKLGDYFFNQQLEPSFWAEKDKRIETGKTISGKTLKGEYALSGSGIYRKDKMRNMRTVWSINTRGKKECHFATFPLELPTKGILAGCPEGGIVLDPFFGSGTTGIAARDNNRNWIGIELNSEYIDIAKNIMSK